MELRTHMVKLWITFAWKTQKMEGWYWNVS